jgi:hypothetical protein
MIPYLIVGFVAFLIGYGAGLGSGFLSALRVIEQADARRIPGDKGTL